LDHDGGDSGVGFVVEEVLLGFDLVVWGAAWRFVAVSAGVEFRFGSAGRVLGI